MSTFLEKLIQEPEPWPIEALHGAKVVLGGLGVISLPAAVALVILGISGTNWLYASIALIAAATLVAVVANSWSANLFARRAEPLGLTRKEARDFWRTYD